MDVMYICSRAHAACLALTLIDEDIYLMYVEFIPAHPKTNYTDSSQMLLIIPVSPDLQFVHGHE